MIIEPGGNPVEIVPNPSKRCTRQCPEKSIPLLQRNKTRSGKKTLPILLICLKTPLPGDITGALHLNGGYGYLFATNISAPLALGMVEVEAE